MNKKQQDLFEEARRKLIDQENNSKKRFCSDSPIIKQMLESYNKLDYEIGKIAGKKADEYMSSKNYFGKESHEKIKEVYKILLFPGEFLLKFFMTLTLENLKKEFHRIIKNTHPDKNSHPNANEAFQKVYQLYSICLLKNHNMNK